MKIVSVPRVSALGKTGPEMMGDRVLLELGISADIINIENEDISKDEQIIYSKAKSVLGGKEKIVFLGGDHSITYPLFKAYKELKKDAFLIVFDAHADCMPPMKEPTHEEFLRAIIEEGFPPENIILIGVRKSEPEEKRFLKEKGVKVFSEIHDLEAIGDYVTEKAIGHSIYVSVDIDVVDPAFAPAVNYPEVNGLSSKEFFYLLKRIFHLPNVEALDVVELVPEKDEKHDFRTTKLTAKIVEEFIGR
jgi:arginase family enzyme